MLYLCKGIGLQYKFYLHGCTHTKISIRLLLVSLHCSVVYFRLEPVSRYFEHNGKQFFDGSIEELKNKYQGQEGRCGHKWVAQRYKYAKEKY